MKKAKCAIVTHRNNHIYNLTLVNCKGDYINLINHHNDHAMIREDATTFKGMLQNIVTLSRINGYDIEHHYCFGCDFYNISVINLDDKKGLIENSFPVKDFMFDNDKMHR